MLSEFYAVMGNAPEVTGALNAMAVELLSEASVQQIAGALKRCERECEFPVRLPHIFKRIDQPSDGRPGVEEAWARMPKGEHVEDYSVVWCEEERAAYEACRSLLLDGNEIAARMAFKEVYERQLNEARSQRRPVRWSVSAGFDVEHRMTTLSTAVREKRLSLEGAMNFVPGERQPEFVRMLPAGISKGLLVGKVTKMPNLPGLAGVLAKMKMDGIVPEDFKRTSKPKEDQCRKSPLNSPEQRRERLALLKQQSAQLKKRRRSEPVSESSPTSASKAE